MRKKKLLQFLDYFNGTDSISIDLLIYIKKNWKQYKKWANEKFQAEVSA